MKSKQNFDVLLIGAGPAGLCMANALAQHDFKIALIDRQDPHLSLKADYDGRTTAFAYGSAHILTRFNLWQHLETSAQPITQISVSLEKSSGHIHYQPPKAGHPFGYILENHILRKVLWERLSTFKNVTVFSSTELEKITFAAERVEARLNDETELSAPLCLAADGKNSAVRQLIGINATDLPYHQTALVFVMHHDKSHEGRAFEHFLSTGPLAFLPMRDDKSSVVWSLKTPLAEIMRQLPAEEFTQEVQLRFGDVLGKLNLEGKIWSFPLSAMVCHKYIHQRIAFIGDAAHTIHPVAGQGFNLGLRDINILHQLLCNAQKLGLDLGSATLLQTYQKQRRLDIHSMTGITDGLVRLLSRDSFLLSHLAGFGFSFVNRLPSLKNLLTRHAMGL